MYYCRVYFINAAETLKGLENTQDYQNFINDNSDVPFQDRYFFKSDIPEAIAEDLFATPLNGIYGPYKLGNNNNISKVIGITQMPDSVQSRHILIRYQGSFRASDAISRSKEDAKAMADSIAGVLKRNKNKFEDLAIPTIILTTSNYQKDLLECYKLGISGYILKPLKYDDYVDKITLMLSYWSHNELIGDLL